MSSTLRTSAPQEQELERKLRDEILRAIESRNLTTEEVASALRLLPSGAKVLLREESWPVETGLRVAGALGIGIQIVVDH